jgi:hypothetical protein
MGLSAALALESKPAKWDAFACSGCLLAQGSNGDGYAVSMRLLQLLLLKWLVLGAVPHARCMCAAVVPPVCLHSVWCKSTPGCGCVVVQLLLQCI